MKGFNFIHSIKYVQYSVLCMGLDSPRNSWLCSKIKNGRKMPKSFTRTDLQRCCIAIRRHFCIIWKKLVPNKNSHTFVLTFDKL